MKTYRQITLFAVLGFLVGLLLVTVAAGQEIITDRGRVELGVRQVWGDVYGRPDLPFKPSLSTSRFNEYRAVPNGFFVQNFKLNLDSLLATPTFLQLQARDTLERDQSYVASVGRYGKYKVQFRYDQTPHNFSNTTRMLYAQTSPGVYKLTNLVRTTLETTSSANMPAAINGLLPSLSYVDASLRRNTGIGSITLTPNAEWTLGFQYSREKQRGYRPIGGHMYASPSGAFVELPEPINYRTQQIKGGAEYGNQRFVLQTGYLGSLFENKIGELVWDNPFRITPDLQDKPVTGRTDLYPDNSAHTLNFAGAIDLSRDVRLMSSISPGWMRQNDAFLPTTTNTAIPGVLPLPVSSLNGEKTTLAMNHTLAARPIKNLALVARYRQYDYNNNTASHAFSTVQADTTTADHGPVVHENHAFAYNKKTFEITGAFSFLKNNQVKFGYEREGFDRHHRDVPTSTENALNASVDLNPTKQLTFRLAYRHADRSYDLYEDEDPTQLAAARRFDEAARVRDRVDASLQFTPLDAVSFGASFGTLQDNYDQPDAHNPVVYGLLKDIGTNYTFDLNVAATKELSVFAEYTREKYRTRMRSRQRGYPPSTPGNDLEINDWFSNSTDKVDTYAAGVDVFAAKGKVMLTTFYSLSAVNGSILTRALGAPGMPGFIATSAANYPNTYSRLHQLVTSVKFKLAKNVSPKFEYRLDQYDRVDMQTDKMNPYMFSYDTGTRTMLFLGADTPSYRGHVVAASVEYRF